MTLKKSMRAAVIAVTVLAAVGLDQLTKAAARDGLSDGRMVPVLGGVLILRYAENDGAFLGLGSRFPQPFKTIFTLALPIAIIAGMIFYLARKKEAGVLLAVGAACVIGGGASNLLDRILYGGMVSDFMNFGIGSFRVTGILNVADLFITLGCVLLFATELARSRDEKKERPGDAAKE